MPAASLTPRQIKAVAALLEHERLVDAAKACGVPERTLTRWRNEDPAFRAALSRAGADLLRDAVRVLQVGASAAAIALVGMANGTALAVAPRINAAKAVLDSVTRLTDLVDLAARVAALEARGSDPPPPPATPEDDPE